MSSSSLDASFINSMTSRFPRTDFMKLQSGAVAGGIVVSPPSPNGGIVIKAAALFSTAEEPSPQAVVAYSQASDGPSLNRRSALIVASHSSIEEDKEAMAAVYSILSQCGNNSSSSVPPPPAPNVIKISDQTAHLLDTAATALANNGNSSSSVVFHVECAKISEQTAVRIRDLLLFSSKPKGGACCGVFLSTCPWGTAQVTKRTVDALPCQLLMRPMGLQFTDGYARGPITCDRRTTFRSEVAGGAKGSIARTPAVSVFRPPQNVAEAEAALLGTLGSVVGGTLDDGQVQSMVSRFPHQRDFMKMQSGAVAGVITMAPPSGVRAAALFTTMDRVSPQAVVAYAVHEASGSRIIAAAHNSIEEDKEAMAAIYSILSQQCGHNNSPSSVPPPNVIRISDQTAHLLDTTSNNKQSNSNNVVYHVDAGRVSDQTACKLRDVMLMRGGGGCGVLVASCPWGHAQLSKRTVDALPTQLLLRPMGLQFADGYAKGPITCDRDVTRRADATTTTTSAGENHHHAGFTAQQVYGDCAGSGSGSLIAAVIGADSPHLYSAPSSSSSSASTVVDSMRNLCGAIGKGLHPCTPVISQSVQRYCDVLATLLHGGNNTSQHSSSSSASSPLLSVPTNAKGCGPTQAAALLDAMLQVPCVRAHPLLVPPFLQWRGRLGEMVYNTKGTTPHGGVNHQGAVLSVAPRTETTGGHGLISTGYYALPGEMVRVSLAASAGATTMPDGEVECWSVRIGCHSDIPPKDCTSARRLSHITSEKTLRDLTKQSQSQSQQHNQFISNAYGGLVYLVRHHANTRKLSPFTLTLSGGIMRSAQVFSSSEAWAAYECRVLSPSSEQYSQNLPMTHASTSTNGSLGSLGSLPPAPLAPQQVDAIAGEFPPMMEVFGEHIIVSLNVGRVLAAGGRGWGKGNATKGVGVGGNKLAGTQHEGVVDDCGVSCAAASCRHMDAVLRDHHTLSQRGWPTPNAQRLVFDVTLSCGYMHSGYPVMAHSDPSEDSFLNANALLTKGDWGFYHEFGHNHQRPAWTFNGTGEVTVNLFTLHAMLRRHGIRARDSEWMKGQHDAIRRYWAAVRAAAASARSSGGQQEGGTNNAAVARVWSSTWCNEAGVALGTYAEVAEAFGWEPFAKVFREYEQLREQRKADAWPEEVKRSQFFLLLSEAVGFNIVDRVDKVWGMPLSNEVLVAANHLPPFNPTLVAVA